MKKMAIKQEVKTILVNYPITRDSDKELFIQYALEHGDIDLAKAIRKSTLPNFETIRRARQKVQEENELLRASETVQQMRFDEECEWRDFADGRLEG